MRIVWHSNFRKKFKKLPHKMQDKVLDALTVFQDNPFDPHLKNHPLVGKLAGQRAFSVTGDLRVLFEEYDTYVLVLLLDVGTHSQVY